MVTWRSSGPGGFAYNGYDFFFGFLFPMADSAVMVVEYPGTATMPITGRFSVDGGYSTSCP